MGEDQDTEGKKVQGGFPSGRKRGHLSVQVELGRMSVRPPGLWNGIERTAGLPIDPSREEGILEEKPTVRD